MPRTRRAGTPGAAPDDPAVTGDTQAPESFSAAESAAEDTAPKPRRRRTPRPASFIAADVPAPSAEMPPAASPTPTPEAAPKRRGGRRRPADDAAPSMPTAADDPAMPSAELSGSRQRGRG